MHIAIAERDDRVAFLRLGMILRTIRYETGSRKLRDNPIALDDAIDGIGDDFPNYLSGQVPLGENLANLVFAPAGDHNEHPFLRFTQQNLIRRHSFFAV